MILVDNYEQMTARPELGCNLECVKDDLASDNVHEYCGPVKIVVVETPKQEYFCKAWGAGFLAYANMLIGAICFIILLREAAHGKNNPDSITSMHMVLCTLGLLFYSSLGMINIFSLFGGSAPLKKQDRQREHMLFQSLGILFGFAGGIFFMSGLEELDFSSGHTLSCICGLILGFGALVTGFVFARFLPPNIITTAVHVIIGTLAFLLNWCCFLSSIDYDYPRKFLKRLAKYSGRPTVITISLGIMGIIAFSSCIYILMLFKPKRKATCMTFDEKLKKKKEKQEKEDK